jgi:hypothetical protein
MFADILKDQCFYVEKSDLLDCLTPTIKSPYSFEISGVTDSVTWHYIPEDLNP